MSDPAANAPSTPVAADATETTATEHLPRQVTADHLPFISWGEGSQPSVPSVDNDSTKDYDSDAGSVKSSTISVQESIYDYVEENGRTYHRFKEGKYLLPNDKQEQERLEIQHALFLVTLHRKLYLAPIPDDVKRVLDVATGTGIWAIEFAQLHPNAQVIGTDLSPIQPTFVPPNCSFQIDDAEDPWTFTKPFDFIHGRALLSCFRDPAAVIKSMYDNLAPGGYLELQDPLFPMNWIESPPPEDSALYRWNKLVLEGPMKIGRDFTCPHNYPRWMREVGFEDIVERIFYWPVSPWAKGEYFKTIAAYLQADLLNGLEGMSLKSIGLLGWSPDKIREFLVDVRKDILDTSKHAYLKILIIYGRKPLQPKSADAKSGEEVTATSEEAS